MGMRLRHAVLILLVQAVLFWRHALFLGYAIPWDLQTYHLAHAHLYAEALRQGELPLWDPYTYSGRPVQANIQAQVFYPPMAAVALAGSWLGDEWLLDLLELSVVGHVWLAGVLAFRLGRRIGLADPAAMVVGTVYMLGGFFAAHGQHLGAVSVAAWLPLVLDCLSRPVSRRNGLALAAALCLTILSGMTPATIAVFGLAAVFAILKRKRVGMLAAAMVGASFLAAVQLGPTIELMGLSVARYRADWMGAGGGVPLKALWSLAWPNYHGVFDPSTYKEPYDLTFLYLYCGLLALGLAVWAIRWSAVFAVMAGVSCLLMLGDTTWLGKTAYLSLPELVRGAIYPQYAAPVFVLSLAALAGIGLDRVKVAWKWKWLMAAACAVDLIGVSSGRPMNAMAEREPRYRLSGLKPAIPPWRTDTAGNTMAWATSAPITKIPSANGYDPMALERYMKVRLGFCKGERWGAYYEVADPHSPLLAMLNVRYLITREKLALDWPRRDIPGYFVYENERALPRFWTVGRVRAAEPAREFRPIEEAIVEGHTAMPATAGTVKVLRYAMREVELEVDSPGATYLVSSEVHYPGWRARLDGEPRELLYTNGAFRGMTVPAGRHRVVWRFEPALLYWCGLASLCAWGLWLVLYLTAPPANQSA
jgi:hypothetical protein